MTLCLIVGLNVRVAPFATKIAGLPFAPKCFLNVAHVSPRRACGDPIANKHPPVVAKDGLTAAKISLSGLRLSSDCHMLASSAIAATAVMPLIVLNDAGRICMSTRFRSDISSRVICSVRGENRGLSVKIPFRKLKICAACWVDAAMIGSTPRSPRASTPR